MILQYQVNPTSQVMQNLLCSADCGEFSTFKYNTRSNQDSIIGSNISFVTENTPAYANINTSHVLVAPEYKGDLRTQPVSAKLTQFE